MSYNRAMDANSDNERSSFVDQFRLAAAFLTRLPVERRAEDGREDPEPGTPASLAESIWLFPLVGFGIGGAGAIVLALLAWLGVPPVVAVILAVGVTVLVTGALHEDGLSDVADGFGGGRDRASKLEIMRDSRLGAYGALTLAVVVVAKIAALATIADWHVGAAAGAMIASATWSRAMFAPLMRWLAPARADGLGAGAGTPGEWETWKGLILGALLAVLMIVSPAGAGVIVVLAVGGLAAFAMGWIAMRQIGGYTGDVLGAAQQVAEVATLVAASAAIVGGLH